MVNGREIPRLRLAMTQWQLRAKRAGLWNTLDPRLRGDDDSVSAPACGRGRNRHFTPCISFWISGAIRNSSTPEPTSTQKPKV